MQNIIRTIGSERFPTTRNRMYEGKYRAFDAVKSQFSFEEKRNLNVRFLHFLTISWSCSGFFKYRLISDKNLSLSLEIRILICKMTSRIRISPFLWQTIVAKVVCLILSISYMSFNAQGGYCGYYGKRIGTIVAHYVRIQPDGCISII